MQRRVPLRKLTEQHLERMNIGKRYWRASLNDFPASHKAAVIGGKYVRNFAQHFTDGRGLFFYGANGTGKTHAMCAILKEVQRLGYSTYCVEGNRLRQIYIEREAFDADMQVHERVSTVDVLLIDDIGKEYSGRDSGWAELCLENTLRHRSRNLMPTLMNANLTPNALKERYKVSAFSLVKEAMYPVPFDGDDHRNTISQRSKELFT